MRFHRYVEDTVTARIDVSAVKRNIVYFTTVIRDNGTNDIVVSGEATVLVPTKK